ncbi:uncharacterized protein [Nicotiana sylvestris]|uniref:uncharacterized protein n=1 Tax=Nicotiana sylvestris TaxID=4096 RepID=UPI00388C98D4
MGDKVNMSYKELCMFPDVRLPAGFKVPKFNLYDGCGDPVAHLRVNCSEIRSVGEKDDLLIAYFSESLTGAALEWHNRQDVGKWHTLGDMAQDFVRHFQYKLDITLDRSSLYKMEKKPEESFREFELRWREQAARVSPPIGEEEMVELFLQAQGPTCFSHLILTLGKPFYDVVKMGEMVEEGIKSGKIMSYSASKDTMENIQNIAVSSSGRKRNRKDDPLGIPAQRFQPRHRPRDLLVHQMILPNATSLHEYENSSEILGGPRTTKISALSEVDLKNEPAKGTQKQFVKNNVMKTWEGHSIVDAEFSG